MRINANFASRVLFVLVLCLAISFNMGCKKEATVYITGTPVVNDIGDPPNLPMGKYLSISKSVEVYAYNEETESKTKTERKGITRKKVKKTKKTYSYNLDWTSSPRPVSEFKSDKWRKWARQNRVNPNIKNPTILPAETKVRTPRPSTCKVNNYDIDIQKVSFYGGSKRKGPIYVRGSEGSPRLGDKRVSYSVTPANKNFTFIGDVSGNKIVEHCTKGDKCNLAAGPGTYKQVMKSIASAESLYRMLAFGLGFILMAGGLIMLAGPVTTLLEFIPFLGDLGSGLIKFVLGLIALILSAIFWFAIKFWYIIAIVVIGLVAFSIYKKQAAPA